VTRRSFLVVWHSGMSGGRAFLDGDEPITAAQIEAWEGQIGRDTGNHPVAVTNVMPLPGPEPSAETVDMAAKRAARWLAKHTHLSPETIIACEFAIRDLAGPT
jgi:hypothetical protein